jgi:cytosine/adenosine deaminase-related metal-dependent hydrolase
MSRRPLLLLAFLAACGGGSSGSPDANGADDDGGDDAPAIDASVPDSSEVPPDGEVETGIVQCPTALTAPTQGECDVAAGTGTAVVLQGNVLGLGVTYIDGAVVYDGDLITYVGCDPSSAPGFATATVITCAGDAISPGLINAHDHVTYDERAPNADATRWTNRNGWRGHYSSAGNQQLSDGSKWTEIRQVMAGTTSINGSVAAANVVGMARNIDKPLAPDVALGFQPVEYQTFILNDQSVNTTPANCGYNFEYTETEVAELPALFTHTAEGIDARAHSEIQCVESNQGGARDFVETNTAHVHIIAGNAADFYNLAHDGTSLVWSPRSNLALFGNTTEAQTFAQLGGNLAIGTDWTYSGSATLLRELACVDSWNTTYLNGYFSDEDQWRMATINAARALNADTLTGSIEVGKLADLAVFHADAGETYRAIIDASDADVALVVRDGDVLYGEDDVVAALDGTCEVVTDGVCGQPRRLCATREIGKTFEVLGASLAADAYPAIFCGAPDHEPTCVPSRPTEYDGTISAGDNDGDGIANTSDDCPDVFNPVRPVDNGAQADVDDDGVGDACDPTPAGNDLDNDGAANAVDTCPLLSDDQTDTDSDGKGDACESCIETPNPLLGCPVLATSIVDIQNGTVPTGAAIRIVGAVVTGVGYNGFSIQDPTVASGEYAGVYIYTSTAPTVAIGEIVEVSGPVTEFHGLTEIGGPSPATIVSHVAGGTVPTPISITVAMATDERWESVLVTLTGITSVTNPYACTTDDAACSDTNVWRLNSSVNGWDSMYEGTDVQWTAAAAALGAGDTVTGVVGYRFSSVRIQPRLLTDF